MRLKSIKLAGFKSFVDPTTVHFPSNLSSVVGPNGCGKSNIIDAVRWVMGESSAKNLRGEAMTDVIFNGSSSRKPVGQASIELVFDNSDGTITGEYAGFAEIAVRRKVTRENQNFYYLNGSKCRRRDITDIFLGTGLGPRSYAIIEQGMISRLIEAKPEELRVYIEEAAGISKYKERRRDTENRMNRTRENLERLTDIRDELERQLSRLERQSQAAEKYREYKELERELKAQLHALRYMILATEAEKKQKAITELELSVEASVTEQVHHDSAIEKHRTEHSELSDKFNEVQGRYYAIGADIARIEQTIQHAHERERQLKIDLDQVTRDCAEAEEHLSDDRIKAEGWEAELLEIEPELSVIKEAEEISAEVLVEAEEGMHLWQQDWDHFNQKAAEPRQQAEVQQSRIKYLEQVQQRIIERMDKLEAERDNLVVGDVKDEIDALEEALGEAALTLDDKKIEIEGLSEHVEAERENLHTTTDKRDNLRNDLQTSKGRLASLEALQQAALAGDSETANQWLESQGLGGDPRLVEKISVDDEWRLAAEVVLGKSLQAVCAEQTIDAISSKLAELDKGELMLVQGANASSTNSNSSAAGSLASKIRGDVDVSHLVAGVSVAENLGDALARRASLAAGESIVTQDGIWLGANWIKVVKADDAEGGVIARKEEIESLRARIETLESDGEKLSAELENIKHALRDAESKRERLRSEAEDLGRQHGELRAQLSGKKAKVEQVLEGRERAERDIDEAKAQLAAESENLVDARTKLHDAIAAMEEDTSERETLLVSRDTMRSKLDEARQKARHDKDRAHALAMQHQSVKTQLESVHQGIQRLNEQMQRMAKSLPPSTSLSWKAIWKNASASSSS